MMKFKKIITHLVLVVLCYSPSLLLAYDKRDIVAAYIYNFAKFVEWPKNNGEQSQHNLVVCVMGEKSRNVNFDSIASKRINDKPLKIHYDRTPDQIRECHIVYYPMDAPSSFYSSLGLDKLTRQLTVSDKSNFTKHQGIIGLVEVKGRIKFQINLRAAKKAGLVISSKLLKLAIDVQQ